MKAKEPTIEINFFGSGWKRLSKATQKEIQVATARAISIALAKTGKYGVKEVVYGK